MVLILLSSPNHLNPLWPSTPRSIDASCLSPRTPLTPSPSFFAILSPIFTADDNVPGSPGGLLQVSPGVIPPETPPPWLLGPRSPAESSRPTVSRANSYYDIPTPNLPKAIAGDKSTPRIQRPGFPSTTYSFTGGQIQAFRPPPPFLLKRGRTEPGFLNTFSPLRQAFQNTTTPLPALKVRPPSQEQLKGIQVADEDLLQSPEAEMLTISMMDFDLEPSTSPIGETMNIPIVFEAPASFMQGDDQAMDLPMKSPRATRIESQPESGAKHSRSDSAPASSYLINATSSAGSQHMSTSRQSSLGNKWPHRMTMSVANLQQLDQETGCAHLKSRHELR